MMDSELAEEIEQHQNLFLQRKYNEQQIVPIERNTQVTNEAFQNFNDAKKKQINN